MSVTEDGAGRHQEEEVGSILRRTNVGPRK